MSHVFHIPDDVYTELVAYNPANDPLAPFIGGLDSGSNELDWIERHDEYFARGGNTQAGFVQLPGQ